jgi:hypothetical protein
MKANKWSQVFGGNSWSVLQKHQFVIFFHFSFLYTPLNFLFLSFSFLCQQEEGCKIDISFTLSSSPSFPFFFWFLVGVNGVLFQCTFQCFVFCQYLVPSSCAIQRSHRRYHSIFRPPVWHNRLLPSRANDVICRKQVQGNGLHNRSLGRTLQLDPHSQWLYAYNSRGNITTRNQKWERTANK